MGLVLAASIGCRGSGIAKTDPGTHFSPMGEALSRSLGIYSAGERVGTHQAEKSHGIWDGHLDAVRVSETTELNLAFRGERFVVRTRQVSFLESDSLALLGSISEIDFGGDRWKTLWVREGRGRYRKVEMMGGREHSGVQFIPETGLTMGAVNLFLDRLEIDPGKEWSDREVLYHMTLERALPVDISWKGKRGRERGFEISVWGMEEEIWLDEDGMVVRETMPWGVEAHHPGPDERLGSLSLESVFAQTAIPVKGAPVNLGDIGSAVLILEGVPETPPSTPWQSVLSERDKVIITLKKPLVPPKGEPGKIKQPGLPGDSVHLSENEPRIQELAARITEGMEDPWQKAAAIGEWVYRNLGKSMRECLTAIEALEAGEGECQSHSLLTVALCRAADIPARFVYGAVYMPDRGAYLFHTWVDVYVGQWVPIDPTLGNFPAGVDHLVLGMGGYMDQFQVFPYILGGGRWGIVYRGEGGEN